MCWLLDSRSCLILHFTIYYLLQLNNKIKLFNISTKLPVWLIGKQNVLLHYYVNVMFTIITKNVSRLQCTSQSPRDQTPCGRWSHPWSRWCWTQVSGPHICHCRRSCSSHGRCHHRPCQRLSPVSPPAPGTCSGSRDGDSWDVLETESSRDF